MITGQCCVLYPWRKPHCHLDKILLKYTNIWSYIHLSKILDRTGRMLTGQLFSTHFTILFLKTSLYQDFSNLMKTWSKQWIIEIAVNKISDDVNVFFDYLLFSFCNSLNIFFPSTNLKEHYRFFLPIISLILRMLGWFSYFWIAQKTGSVIWGWLYYPQDYCLCWDWVRFY